MSDADAGDTDANANAEEAGRSDRTGAVGDGESQPLLEVEDLHKYFTENDGIVDRLLGRERRSVRAVDGVSFEVERSETLGVVGESGCGKSTTGETLLALQEPTDGDVRFDGRSVFGMDEEELEAFRRRAQVVFQDPFSSLDPRQTAGDIVTEALVIHGRPASDPSVRTEAAVETDGIPRDRVDVTVADDVDRVVAPTDGVATVHVAVRRDGDGVSATVEEDLEVRVVEQPYESGEDRASVRVSVGRSNKQLRRERAKELLERVGLSAGQVDRYPHEFSGGQRQRVGIARALALSPEFLVLDEPVSALDVSVQAQILNLLADLQDEFDLTYLFIAHDLSVVRHISDRVAVMYLGEIVETGPVDDIFEDPAHPYTEALLESVPRASTEESGRRVDALEGDVPSPRNPPSGCRFHTRCPYAREVCRESTPESYDAGGGQRAACFRLVEEHEYWESEPLEHANGSDEPPGTEASDEGSAADD